jgi:hypothetical protein
LRCSSFAVKEPQHSSTAARQHGSTAAHFRQLQQHGSTGRQQHLIKPSITAARFRQLQQHVLNSYRITLMS